LVFDFDDRGVEGFGEITTNLGGLDIDTTVVLDQSSELD
jgi:hypothetical protein